MLVCSHVCWLKTCFTGKTWKQKTQFCTGSCPFFQLFIEFVLLFFLIIHVLVSSVHITGHWSNTLTLELLLKSSSLSNLYRQGCSNNTPFPAKKNGSKERAMDQVSQVSRLAAMSYRENILDTCWPWNTRKSNACKPPIMSFWWFVFFGPVWDTIYQYLSHLSA